MKVMLLSLLAAVVLCGCATKSTVPMRKQERYAAYSELSPEFKNLVDKEQIKIGMPMDAVYIAWGKPSQIINGETPQGKTTTWIYEGSYWETHRYWTYRYYYYGRRGYPEPYLEHEYIPRSFIRAEVVFQDGVVKQWHTLPQPQTY